MPNPASVQLRYTGSEHRASANRAVANRANAERSTGPRSARGKLRSSQNALSHGLTARAPVLPSEDPALYASHCARFFDEYEPANPTETELVRQLADTAWRLNRVPLLEADLLTAAGADVREVARLLSSLGLHSQRLSRQFQKTIDHLRQIQSGRRSQEQRQLRDAAALFEFHKHHEIPFCASTLGFVFSEEQIERYAQYQRLLNQSRHIEHVRFHIRPAPPIASAAAS